MKKISERLIFLCGSVARRPFAEQLGITESTLRNYEQEKSSPNAETIEIICKKLRIAPEWLILGTGPIHPEKGQPANTTHPEQAQPSETTSTITCARCEKLEAKLEKMESQRDELVDENRRLLKENGLLREENATLRERQRKEQASPFDEHQKMPETRRTSCSNPELHP